MFLRQKYKGETDDDMNEPPKGLEHYKNAEIFSRLKYEKYKKDDPAVCIVGDMRISEKERKALSLPPKFGPMARLLITDFENDIEIG